MSDSVRPHRWKPTRLPRPWDSPSKNTGVGCHFLLQCMKVKSESEVAQSCPTLCDPPRTAAYQAPLPMGFSRQEYWSGLPLLSPFKQLLHLKPTPYLKPSTWQTSVRNLYQNLTQCSYYLQTDKNFLGFPGGTRGKEPACQCRRHKRHGFDQWVRKIPWRRAWQHNILAWRTPWTEEPGGLQYIGLQRVRHNWNNLVNTYRKMGSRYISIRENSEA